MAAKPEQQNGRQSGPAPVKHTSAVTENAAGRAKIGAQSTSAPSGKARLREILSVLNRHELMKGLSPQKLREVLEDLGPTFVKLGQIMSMRPDMIPRDYAAELVKLRTDVNPMPIDEVTRIVEASFDCKLDAVFSEFDPKPLGSASIAQVHEARLKDGRQVVVKVQREGIHDTMFQDISLLRKNHWLLNRAFGTKDVVDFRMILDEMWTVTQEEMDFLIEARNMEEFSRLNSEVAFVSCPALYREYTTSNVLVMGYVDGYSINEKEQLQRDGYDLNEIGTKLADNYIKQIIEDGFFQADPHPGNLRVQDGRIVWIDLGMMGRITPRDKEIIAQAVEGIAKHDVNLLKDCVLSLGECRGRINHGRLYTDIDDLLNQYGSMEIGGIDLAKAMDDLLDVTKRHKISMPHGLSMLARGLATIEGVLADISPDISIIRITANRMAGSVIKNFDWKKELEKGGRTLYESSQKAIELPSLLWDMLQMTIKGHSKTNLELHTSDDLTRVAYQLINKLIGGVLVAALLVGSSLICTTQMKPKILGIPALGVIGYVISLVLTVWIFWDTRRKR